MDIAKEKRAIDYLKNFQPQSEPYYLCYSGGKDSDTILILAKLAGVNFEAVHNLTTVDEPATVQYVKSNLDVWIDTPQKTMWQLIAEKGMPPTRLIRYCCEKLKEHGGKGRLKITGVRRAESTSRNANGGFVKIIGKPKTTQRKAEEMDVDYEINSKGGLVLNMDNDENRRFVEMCYRTTSTMVNPILDWTDADVWEFLHHYGCRSNPLYEVKDLGDTYCPVGCKRIGCVCCPMKGSKGMKSDLIRLPKYRDNYLRAFSRMLETRREKGLKIPEKWKDARSVMMWWVGDDPLQMSLFGEPEYLKGACM